jgi:hypothetical protein
VPRLPSEQLGDGDSGLDNPVQDCPRERISNTPGKTVRHLVRDAIAAATDERRELKDIEVPTEEVRAF